MRTFCCRPIAVAAFVAALTPGAQGQSQPAVRHDLDGVWAIRPATSTPRTAFECCVVDPRLRPPMTAWGQARFDAAVPSSRSPGPEGDRVVPGKENDPALSC